MKPFSLAVWPLVLLPFCEAVVLKLSLFLSVLVSHSRYHRGWRDACCFDFRFLGLFGNCGPCRNCFCDLPYLLLGRHGRCSRNTVIMPNISCNTTVPEDKRKQSGWFLAYAAILLLFLSMTWLCPRRVLAAAAISSSPGSFCCLIFVCLFV